MKQVQVKHRLNIYKIKSKKEISKDDSKLSKYLVSLYLKAKENKCNIYRSDS